MSQGILCSLLSKDERKGLMEEHVSILKDRLKSAKEEWSTEWCSLQCWDSRASHKKATTETILQPESAEKSQAWHDKARGTIFRCHFLGMIVVFFTFRCCNRRFGALAPMGMAKHPLDQSAYWLCRSLQRRNISGTYWCILKVAWGVHHEVHNFCSHNWETPWDLCNSWIATNCCLRQWNKFPPSF